MIIFAATMTYLILNIIVLYPNSNDSYDQFLREPADPAMFLVD